MPEHPPRDDNATTSTATPDIRSCPICASLFQRIRRQRYCSDTCRRTAWRRRHAATQPEPAAVPAARSRQDTTVYQCGECEQRYLGEQWCHDCAQPCRRIGTGALCPHCDEPVAIPDLLEAAEHPASREVHTMPDR